MKTNDWNKKKYIRKMLVFFAVLLAVLLPKGIAARVYGSSGTVSNLKQTGATTNSADIQFTAFLGSDVEYKIRVGTSAGSVAEYTTLSALERTVTISGLSAGSTYYVKVVPFDGNGEIEGASAGVSVVTVPEKAPSSITQTASGTDSVTISWSAVSGASGYLVDYFLTNSESGTPETASLTATGTSAVLTGLSASKTYTANVTPYRISSEGYMAYDSSVFASKKNLAIGATSEIGTPQGTVSGFVQEGATVDSARVSFTPPDETAQYSVQLSTKKDSGFTEKAVVTKGDVSLTELKAASTYYVRVVPFYTKWNSFNEEDDRSYGTASEIFEIVTAPDKTPEAITQIASGTDSVTISWNAVSGASGYIVDYFLSGSESTAQEKNSLTTDDGESDSDSFTGVSVSGETVRLTTTDTSATLTGLSDSKTYTAHVTPYRAGTGGYMAYDSTVYASKSNLSIGATLVTGTPQGTVSGFVQKNATADSATVSFQIPDTAAQYSVQFSTSKTKGFTEYAVVTDGSVSLTGLKSATSYYVRVLPFYKKWNSLNGEYDRVYGTVSGVFEIVTAPNAGPKKITQTAATVTGFTVRWDAVDGASGYYVDYYRAGSEKKTTKNITKNQITLTKLAKNSEYNIYVTPYRKSASGFIAVDENAYTGSYNIPVRPSKAEQASVTKFWQSIGKVNLKTKKIACADGYQYVLYSVSSGKDKKIASGSSLSYSSADIKSTKLKKSAVYKVRVRAYVTVKGKKVYGAWSDWTYISASSQVTLTRSKTGIRASWNRVTGAERYLVYISSEKDFGYRKCFVTTNTSCDIKSYGNKSIETGKKYYVYVIPQVKVSDRYVSAAKKDVVAEIK